MRKWFDKYIGCAFTIWVQNKPEEYIYCGTCFNPDTKNGFPLQYEFEAEGKPQVLLNYKEARQVMGTMIEKYSEWNSYLMEETKYERSIKRSI